MPCSDATATTTRHRVMNCPDPGDVNHIAELGKVVGLSGVGGVAAFIKRKKSGLYDSTPWYTQLLYFIGDVMACILAGYVAYKLCLYFRVDEDLQHVAISLSGWGGPSILDALVMRYKERLNGMVSKIK